MGIVVCGRDMDNSFDVPSAPKASQGAALQPARPSRRRADEKAGAKLYNGAVESMGDSFDVLFASEVSQGSALQPANLL